MAAQQVLEIEPIDTVTFSGPFTDVITNELRVRNPTENRIAFKVKTTAPRRYCVRPNSGILNPNENVAVSVMLQPFDYDPQERYRHRFMIQSAVMQPDQTVLEDFWRDVPADQLMDSRIRVLFDADTVRPATQAAAQPVETVSSASVIKAETAAPKISPHSSPSTENPVTQGSVSEIEYRQAREENERLSKELANDRAELARLRNLAMSDTISAGAPKENQTQSGIGLLYQDKMNLVIILSLMLVMYMVGLFTSGMILGS